jgi:hypothetical protein
MAAPTQASRNPICDDQAIFSVPFACLFSDIDFPFNTYLINSSVLFKLKVVSKCLGLGIASTCIVKFQTASFLRV